VQHFSIQALLGLLLSIPVIIYLFKRYSPAKAALLAFLIGTCMLPEQMWIKIPLLPEFGKARLTNLVMLGCVLARPYLPKAERWWYIFPLWSLVNAIGIWMTNPEALVYGPTVCKGIDFKDGVYLFMSDVTIGPVAAYLGMRCFRTERDLKTWYRVLVNFGLFYAMLICVELRMSPQIHRWIYGYAANDAFDQTIRFGGYRPVVMMVHGLATSLFMMLPTMAAMVMARYKQPVWKITGGQAAWFLTIVLILCKSTAVWTYALLALPLARWGSSKAMNRVACVLAVMVCAYPWLRATGYFPVEKVLEIANDISEERMLSLKFRFDNEDVLLEHAMQKPWFGWGVSYGRNMLYDEEGRLMTITDGGWIIAIGNAGLSGLAAFLAIPVLCIFSVAKNCKRIKDVKLRTMLAVLNLYVALHWVDILPNGVLTLFPYFLGGAICVMSHRLSRVRQPRPAPKPKPAIAIPPQPQPTGEFA